MELRAGPGFVGTTRYALAGARVQAENSFSRLAPYLTINETKLSSCRNSGLTPGR